MEELWRPLSVCCKKLNCTVKKILVIISNIDRICKQSPASESMIIPSFQKLVSCFSKS